MVLIYLIELSLFADDMVAARIRPAESDNKIKRMKILKIGQVIGDLRSSRKTGYLRLSNEKEMKRKLNQKGTTLNLYFTASQ